MEPTKQAIKAVPHEFTIATSRFTFVIQNFQDTNQDEAIKSKPIEVLELNAKWSVMLLPRVINKDPCYVVQGLLILEDFEAMKAKSCQLYVTGVSSSGSSLINESFRVLKKETNFGQLSGHCSINALIEQMSEGALTLNFTIEIKCQRSSVDNCNFYDYVAITKSILANARQLLQDDDTFSDFTFVVKEREFKVHKGVLAMASRFFRALFKTGMEESRSNECIVEDTDPDVFEILLRFMYYGELPANDAISMKLFHAADYFESPMLAKICAQEIFYEISADNALEALKFGYMYEQTEVKERAWEILKRDVLKIFVPLKDEPLSLNEVEEFIAVKEKIKEFYAKHSACD